MAKNRPSTKAMGYARVSTGDQKLSPEAQEASITAYCQMHGLDLVGVVRDEGVSGGVPIHKRDGGAEIVEAIEAGKIGHVVAVRLDRLFRSVRDCVNTIPAWDEAGVALHFVDFGGESLHTKSAMGRFMITLMVAIAELERGFASERTRAAAQVKKEKQEFMGGEPPYGQRLAEDGIKLEPNPGEQRILEFICTLRGRRMSYRQICAELNALGIPSRGQSWKLHTLARLKAHGLLPDKPPRKRKRKGKSPESYISTGVVPSTQGEASETAEEGIE